MALIGMEDMLIVCSVTVPMVACKRERIRGLPSTCPSLAFFKSSIQGVLSAYETTGDAAYIDLIQEKLAEVDGIS